MHSQKRDTHFGPPWGPWQTHALLTSQAAGRKGGEMRPLSLPSPLKSPWQPSSFNHWAEVRQLQSLLDNQRTGVIQADWNQSLNLCRALDAQESRREAVNSPAFPPCSRGQLGRAGDRRSLCGLAAQHYQAQLLASACRKASGRDNPFLLLPACQQQEETISPATACS